MQIQLNSVSKRYMKRWILKDLNYTFDSDHIYGITGINGSGKSTLIKIISGYLTPSSGNVIYKSSGSSIERDQVYKHLSISAPYLEIDLDFTLKEQLAFYRKFKALISSYDQEVILNKVGLSAHLNKPIRQFSSGMQQRVQLILSLFSDVDCILLDEPTSFLDKKGKAWFYETVRSIKKGKTIIIASNDDEDIAICEEVLSLDEGRD